MKGAVSFKSFMVILLVMFCFSATGAHAENIKSRMVSRLPVIKDLKARGLIGETNQGFLAFVGGTKTEKDVVAAENVDRRLVYEAIARQQGTTVTVVGKRRASQLADKAAPGEWLQDENGKWHKK